MSLIEPEQALRRFSDSLAGLLPDGDVPLLVALSGGADSMALLWLCATARPGRVHAMTVDHGLRPEATAEARHCAAICARLGVAHRTASPDRPIDGNIQSEARKARYALLSAEAERLGGAHILTAHHADDQIETMLMRLSRGSGVAGLAGIRSANGNIVRPLLGFTKAELVSLCRAAAIEWIEDPSNANPDFDRVRMREALERADLRIDPAALQRTAKALDDADKALAYAADRMIEDRIRRDGDGWTLASDGLPHELVRRLLLHIVDSAGDAVPRGDALERAISALHEGRKVSLGSLVAQGGAVWRFTEAPPRRS